METKPIWDKGKPVNGLIQQYTVGRDREMDMFLARYDVQGSLAHITMLQSIGLLEKDELAALSSGLKDILDIIEDGRFVIEDGVEDVHSQIELMLTRQLGDMGKKIHSGRSRNDQVLVDLKLFTRDRLRAIAGSVKGLFDVLVRQSEKYKDVLLPGYTHLQIAMPSSFGLWLGAYAESLADDMLFIKAAFDQANRNPLGSAAGYGSSFPLNRQMTTDLLGFESMNYNVVYAQMTRGKLERNAAYALASVAATVSRLAFDACLYNSQNFSFIKLPDDCTTGSSIMPHKKNPDVWEIMRGKCNRVMACENEINMLVGNLQHGYHRDLQLLKDILFPALDLIHECLAMADYMLQEIRVREDILDEKIYDYLFTVEEVNRRALAGMPFRDAYKSVGIEVNEGRFHAEKTVNHSHEGSIGNLCTERIKAKMDKAASFAKE